MEVDELIAINVPEVRAIAAIYPNGHGPRTRPTRRNSPRHRFNSPVMELLRLVHLADHDLLFDRDLFVQGGHGD